MKIDKLNINNYGRIENKEIKLKNGLNIIKGYNEAGKSTLLSFITSMLYGIDKKKQGSFISEYDRYMPWNLEEFSGTIEYTLDNGKNFEIFRNFKKKNPIILDSNKNDISLDFKTTKNNIEFFEEQTNIDRQTFLNSGISCQKLVVLNDKNKEQVVQKMANLLSTGKEEVSYSNILKRINSRQIEEIGTYRTKNRPINNIEEEIEKLEREKIEILNRENRKEKVQQERILVQEEFSKIDAKRKLVNEVKEKYLAGQSNNELNIHIYNQINQKQNEIIQRKELKIDTISNRSVFAESLLLNIIVAIVTLLISSGLIIFGILTNDKNLFVEFGVASLLVGIAILSFIYFKDKLKIEKEISKDEEHNRIIEKEVAILTKDILQLEKELDKEKTNDINLKDNYILEIKNNYSDKLDLREIESVLRKNAGELTVESRVLENKYQSTIFKLSSLDAEKAQIDRTAYKLAEIYERLEKLEEEKIELLNYNDAFELSKEIFEETYTEMKKQYGPLFNERLSYIVSKVTNGKYTNCILNNEYGIKVKNENGEYIDLELLSSGTIEQINLSLRIALLEMLEDERLPFILDEAFAFYDEKRLKNILHFLESEYKNRQIIIFTCSNREKNILNDENIQYNYIEI